MRKINGRPIDSWRNIMVSSLEKVRESIRRNIWHNPNAFRSVMIRPDKEIGHPCCQIDVIAEIRYHEELEELIGGEVAHYGEECGLKRNGHEELMTVDDILDGTSLMGDRRNLFGASSSVLIDLATNEPLIAVVADLAGYADTVYWWQRGVGSFFQNRYFEEPEPLRVQSGGRDDAYVSTGAYRPKKLLANLGAYDKIARYLAQFPGAVFDLVHCGSPGMCLCALGAIDAIAYVSGGQICDVLAPTLIVRGAGGKVVDPKTGDDLVFDLDFATAPAEQFEKRYPFICGDPIWASRLLRVLRQ